jgi:hypothetical protein
MHTLDNLGESVSDVLWHRTTYQCSPYSCTVRSQNRWVREGVSLVDALQPRPYSCKYDRGGALWHSLIRSLTQALRQIRSLPQIRSSNLIQRSVSLPVRQLRLNGRKMELMRKSSVVELNVGNVGAALRPTSSTWDA